MPDAPIRADGVDVLMIPPGVADARARAFTAALGRGLDEVPLGRLDLLDFEHVEAALLPALVRGFSLQEFMFDGIPEPVVRRLLAQAIPLHVRKGTQAGIRMALELVGMRLVLKPWYAQVPEAPPNTFKAVVYITEQMLADAAVVLNETSLRAAVAMFNGTKRWSQEGTLAIGVAFPSKLGTAGAAAGMAVDARPAPSSIDLTRRSKVALGSAAAGLAVEHRPFNAKADVTRRSMIAAGGAAAGLAVHRRSVRARANLARASILAAGSAFAGLHVQHFRFEASL